MNRGRMGIAAAAGILALIVTGALATSEHGQAPQAALVTVHRAVVWSVGLASALLLLVRVRRSAGWVSAILIAGVLEGWLGTSDVLAKSPIVAGTMHAWIAALIFAATAGLWWSKLEIESEMGQDFGWPSLRSLSTMAVVFLILQVELGAAYRHNWMSVLPHLLFAAVAVLVVMVAGAFVAQQFPRHPTLRPIAVAVLIVTSVQVALGMTTFVMSIVQPAGGPLALAVRAAHVATGSLTLGSAVILAIEIRRRVRPKSDIEPQ